MTSWTEEAIRKPDKRACMALGAYLEAWFPGVTERLKEKPYQTLSRFFRCVAAPAFEDVNGGDGRR